MSVSSVEQAWTSFPRGLPSTGHPRLSHIMSAVSLHTGVGAEDIKSRRRTKHLVLARQLYCYLARHLTPMSYPNIALSLYRDHTSVLHAVQAVERKLEAGDESYVVGVAICRSSAIHFSGGHE